MTVATPDLFETTTVVSAVLGELAVRADQVLTFAQGIVGFPEASCWTVVATERDGFAWLQSVDEAGLCFLLANPALLVPEFGVDAPAHAVAALQLRDDDEPLVFAIVTLPAGASAAPTANLQAPIVINPRTRRGVQVVLAESAYGMSVAVTL
jgi:flagellar assembly factor FliW